MKATLICKVISQDELELYPEGPPIPSVCSPVGYGDHSCRACLTSFLCPLATLLPHEVSESNDCSFYWPPNQPDWKAPDWYFPALEQVAKERKERIERREKRP